VSRVELLALLEGEPTPRRRRGRPSKAERPVLEYEVVVPRYLWPAAVDALVALKEPFEARVAADGRSVELRGTATVAGRLRPLVTSGATSAGIMR
jgi:hypothetical protein